MAEDEEKEIDDVIGDAMEVYAKPSGYQTGISACPRDKRRRRRRAVRGEPTRRWRTTTRRTIRCAARPRRSLRRRWHRRRSRRRSRRAAARDADAVALAVRAAGAAAERPAHARRARHAAATPARGGQPAYDGAPTGAAPPPSTWCSTTRSTPIDKDQFIIGRGIEDVRPADQGRQHLAQARGRDPPQRDLSTSRTSARRTASTTRACASTTSASTKATSFTSATTSCASPSSAEASEIPLPGWLARGRSRGRGSRRWGSVPPATCCCGCRARMRICGA